MTNKKLKPLYGGLFSCVSQMNDPCLNRDQCLILGAISDQISFLPSLHLTNALQFLTQSINYQNTFFGRCFRNWQQVTLWCLFKISILHVVVLLHCILSISFYVLIIFCWVFIVFISFYGWVHLVVLEENHDNILSIIISS